MSSFLAFLFSIANSSKSLSRSSEMPNSKIVFMSSIGVGAQTARFRNADIFGTLAICITRSALCLAQSHAHTNCINY